MLTQTVLYYLNTYGKLPLTVLYDVTNSYTEKQCHVIRGILSSLKARNLVTNCSYGVWKAI